MPKSEFLSFLKPSRKEQERQEEELRRQLEQMEAQRQMYVQEQERRYREREDFMRREDFLHREAQRRRDEEEERRRDDEAFEYEQDRKIELKRRNNDVWKSRQTSSEALRRLRSLIRQRHQLDIELHSLRKTRRYDRQEVINTGRKADTILTEIYSIVETWEESSWTPEEWAMARQIRDGLKLPGKRDWEEKPPWSDI